MLTSIGRSTKAPLIMILESLIVDVSSSAEERYYECISILIKYGLAY